MKTQLLAILVISFISGLQAQTVKEDLKERNINNLPIREHTITLSNGFPIETVSKLLRHTKIATTRIYAKVIERNVSDDMASLRSKLKLVNSSLDKYQNQS